MNVLSVNNISKWFGKIKAIEKINFEVKKGQVVGVLGPNGSGKTTTLAIVLGIKYPTNGSFCWFDNSPGVLSNSRVGSLLEVPYFFPYLNLERNLKIIAHARGNGLKDIDDVLRTVNLWDRRKSPYYTLSLGMKQRLAIASTLLGDPEVLVLDEPTNGLDPEGIAEVRNLITGLSKRGKTIILASHILDEVEKVCTDVIILKEGAVLSQGKVNELLTEKLLVSISSEDISKLIKVISNYEGVKIIERLETKLLVSLEEGVKTNEINQWLLEQGIVLSLLEIHKKSLESQFLEMVKS